MKQGQETNQIWTHEAGTHDTQQNPDITRGGGRSGGPSGQTWTGTQDGDLQRGTDRQRRPWRSWKLRRLWRCRELRKFCLCLYFIFSRAPNKKQHRVRAHIMYSSNERCTNKGSYTSDHEPDDKTDYCDTANNDIDRKFKEE